MLDYHQNWVRSLFGVGTVHLRSAGGGAHEQDRRITVPWVSRDQLSTILSLGLGRVLDDPDDLPMTGRRHPRDARRRLWFLWLRGAWLPVLLLASVAALALPDRRDEVITTTVGLLVATAVLAVPLGSAQYRRLGHEATDRVALVTGGVLGRRWIWMPLGRLQGVVARANPFQRRLGLVTVVLTPAGGANQPVEIRDVAADRAAELGAHLVAIAAGRRGPVARVGTRHGGRPGPSDGHGPPPARPRVDAPAPPTTDPPGPPLASA